MQKPFSILTIKIKVLHVRLLIVVICTLTLTTRAQTVLIFEDFETGDFSAKGWYDGFKDQRTTNEYKNGTHTYKGHSMESGIGILMEDQ